MPKKSRSKPITKFYLEVNISVVSTTRDGGGGGMAFYWPLPTKKFWSLALFIRAFGSVPEYNELQFDSI
jgi:hypothetical protein